MSKKRKIQTIEEVLETLNIILEDGKYTLKKARSPQKKRSLKWQINFTESVKYYVEKSKQNENN